MQAFGEGESPAFRARSNSSWIEVAWRPGTHAARAKQACAAAPRFASWGASRKATQAMAAAATQRASSLGKCVSSTPENAAALD